MSNKLVVIILIIMILSFMTVNAYANNSIKRAFVTQYDLKDTKLDTCRTCMTSTSTPVSWNPFAIALKNDPDFNRNNPIQALQNIEQLDSDGDGYTNIDEIRNSTFPGDSEDPGDSPATSPDIQTPVSAPAEENTLNTMFNILATLAAIAMVSILVRKKKD